MSVWTEGYVTEIDYTHGYYRELAPAMQRYALIAAGYSPPADDAPYLELGYGQGMSAVIHAASTSCPVWGTDFNPAHAANAQSLVAAAGIDAHMHDDSFAELDNRDDLPSFRYIGLHGVWSWVSNENRLHITNILHRHQAVGGVTYISYNALPGWSALLSLRRLLFLHSETAGADAQGVTGRIEGALAFANQLADNGAAYFMANPTATEWLKRIINQNPHYVAHEYFNRDWDPTAFSDVAEWLSEAKLEFAASANLIDQIPAVNLTPAALSILNNVNHPVLKESIRDYFVNQRFRRDLFVRGARPLSALEQKEALSNLRFALLKRVEDIPLTVTTAIGQVQLQPPIYIPVLEALARNAYRPRSLGELSEELPNLAYGQLAQAVQILVGSENAQAAQSEAAASSVAARTRALNAELCRRARSRGDAAILASPETGSGIPVDRLQQLFVAALYDGKNTPQEWARSAWGVLASQEQKVMRDGKPLETEEESLAVIRDQAETFQEKHLPILRALGIVD
jgi:Predicted methyltransferase regulatory domain